MKIFIILMWKHFKVRKRRWLQTLVEFFTPFSILLGLFILKDMMQKKSGGELLLRANLYPSANFDLDSWDAPANVVFAPDTVATRRLMKEVANLLGKGFFTPAAQFRSSASDNVTSALLGLVKAFQDTTALVEFQNMNSTTLPDQLHYTIKMTSLIPHRPIIKCQRTYEKFENEPHSFLRLQWAIDSSFLKLKSQNSLDVKNITFEGLSDHPAARTQLNKIFVSTVFFLLSYIYFAAPLLPFIFLMNRLLEERATGIQELVKMVGVTPTMLGISHFINSLPTCLIYCIGGTILLKATDAPLVPATNAMIIFLSHFFHFLTTIAAAFPCSYIASDAQHTVSLSMFAYIGMWIPVRLIGHDSPHDSALFFLGLLPHCPAYWFLIETSVAELRYETGVHFDNWNFRFTQYKTGERNGTVLASYIMQLVQIAYFFAFSWYFEKVRPGKYGIALPWNFLCKKEYWTKKVTVPTVLHTPNAPYDPAYQKYFEKPPNNIESGISISHVSKVFGSGKTKFQALNDVTLDIYKGEITVLLGQNGAGKTTLISIITGMINPTSGKIYVNGLDTVTQQSKIRRQLGLCPQHNLFFPDLTVLEHLLFFSMIKGGTFADAKKSSEVLMRTLNLTSHADQRVSELSAGLHRRLQLGCSLCGDANVLILDEPTSGLDVEARRELWDILLGLRGDCTVVLTTHFMEEADVLGDRVAALHAGKLRCHATPMFLKRAVGSGFRVTITTVNAPDEEKITNLIKEAAPNGILKEKSVNTMVFDLPTGSNFPALFKNIENRKTELDIESMGIGITTLEEVFIELCCDFNMNEQDENRHEAPETLTYITGCRNIGRQMLQLFKRQLDFTLSKKMAFLILQVIMPIVLCFTLTKLFNDVKDKIPLRMDLNLDMFSEKGLKGGVHYIKNKAALRKDAMSLIRKAYPTYQFRALRDLPDQSCRNCAKNLKKYAVGISLNDTHTRILYATDLPHTAAIGLNLLSNILAIQNLPEANGKSITTTITNRLPLQSYLFTPKLKMNCALFAILNTCVIMATVINDVALPCRERLTVARHTHIMAGCPPVLYWLTTFLYHMIYFMAICCTAFVTSCAFFDYDKTLDDRHTLFAIFVTVTLCGMNFYMYSYLISFFFGERGASIFLIGMLIGFGFLSSIMIMALDDLKSGDDKPVFISIMDVLGVFIPPHLFVQAIVGVTQAARFNSFCTNNLDKCPFFWGYYFEEGFDVKLCCREATKDKGPYDHFATTKYGGGVAIITMAVQFIVFAILVLLLEYRMFNRCWNAIGRKRIKELPQKRFNCPNVAAEKQLVNSTVANRHRAATGMPLLLNNVWKAYHGIIGKPIFALRDVNFTVKKGECFGVLGVNGAGKTTTFKVISCEETATRGNVYANNHSIGSDKYLHSLGYCPQYNGLDDFRSGTSNLRMLLIMRGLSDKDVNRQTQAWLQVVGMEKAANRIVGGYSGGMVRRLATAASLCGGAAVTLLDEPTAGVDTAARRLVWNALKRGLQHDRAVVIASHGMDEMEKLCGRVTILSSGEMSVLGTPHGLKDQYAAGHSLIFKLHVHVVQSPGGKARVEQLKSKLEEKFKCTLKDEHLTSLYYRINEQLLYSEIFTEIEAIVKEFEDLIEDYSVANTNLEDVFLTFANEAGPSDA